MINKENLTNFYMQIKKKAAKSFTVIKYVTGKQVKQLFMKEYLHGQIR